MRHNSVSENDMNTERRRPWWVWAAAIVVGLPVLYVLSSGPMKSATWQQHVFHDKLPDGRITARTICDAGIFWTTFYAPLVWSADQTWGESLFWYWDQFPVRGK